MRAFRAEPDLRGEAQAAGAEGSKRKIAFYSSLERNDMNQRREPDHAASGLQQEQKDQKDLKENARSIAVWSAET